MILAFLLAAAPVGTAVDAERAFARDAQTIGQWTAFLWPLLIISDDNLQLAPVALASTFGEHAADYGQNFAGSVLLSLLPALVLLVGIAAVSGFALPRHLARQAAPERVSGAGSPRT